MWSVLERSSATQGHSWLQRSRVVRSACTPKGRKCITEVGYHQSLRVHRDKQLGVNPNRQSEFAQNAEVLATPTAQLTGSSTVPCRGPHERNHPCGHIRTAGARQKGETAEGEVIAVCDTRTSHRMPVRRRARTQHHATSSRWQRKPGQLVSAS